MYSVETFLQEMKECPVRRGSSCDVRPHASCHMTEALLSLLPSRSETWLASVHSKSMRGPERGHLCWGKMHCIDQNGTYSPRQIQQQGSVGVRMYESFAKLQIQQRYFAVNFCSQLNIYDSHPLLCLRSSRPSFCSSMPCSLLLPVRPPFPHLLFLSHPPLPSLCPPLPQTCIHRVSSNLALCPWVHTVTKAYCSPFFGHCILSLKRLLPTFPVKRCNFRAVQDKGYYNVPTGCIAITRLITWLLLNIILFQLCHSIILCKGTASQVQTLHRLALQTLQCSPLAKFTFFTYFWSCCQAGGEICWNLSKCQ